MDFGQPNAEIGQKMANGQLLFLGLYGHTLLATTRTPCHYTATGWTGAMRVKFFTQGKP